MAYHITFEPMNRIPGVQPKTVQIEGAAKAWAEVQALMASDEKVRITINGTSDISWQELKLLAEREMH